MNALNPSCHYLSSGPLLWLGIALTVKASFLCCSSSSSCCHIILIADPSLYSIKALVTRPHLTFQLWPSPALLLYPIFQLYWSASGLSSPCFSDYRPLHFFNPLFHLLFLTLGWISIWQHLFCKSLPWNLSHTSSQGSLLPYSLHILFTAVWYWCSVLLSVVP